MKRAGGILFVLLLQLSLHAQPRYAGQDYDFILYLIDNAMRTDAATLLSREAYFPSDTLDFLRGWTRYSLKHLDQAALYFSKVPQGSAFYDKSLFYNVVSNAHIGQYDRSCKLLSTYAGLYTELSALEKAGLALLQDRPEDYLEASSGFTYQDFALSQGEQELTQIYHQRYGTRSKRPWAAGLLSAAVPGLGKIYAGQLGEGVSSFLVIGAMAAIAAENGIKCGFGHWRTLLFGSVCAVFYIGNIYGSYMSVSIYNQHLRDAQNTAILYNIHIPLRTVFR